MNETTIPMFGLELLLTEQVKMIRNYEKIN